MGLKVFMYIKSIPDSDPYKTQATHNTSKSGRSFTYFLPFHNNAVC